MATWVDLDIRDTDTATAAAATEEIHELLGAFEQNFYAWAPGELADLNAAIHAGEDAFVSRDQAIARNAITA